MQYKKTIKILKTVKVVACGVFNAVNPSFLKRGKITDYFCCHKKESKKRMDQI